MQKSKYDGISKILFRFPVNLKALKRAFCFPFSFCKLIPKLRFRVPGFPFALSVTSLLGRRKHFLARLQRQCIALFQFLPPTLDVCSRQVVQPLNQKCSRMASPELSPWAYSLVHFDGIDLVQVNREFVELVCHADVDIASQNTLIVREWFNMTRFIIVFAFFCVDFCSSALKERSDVIERAAIPVTRRVSSLERKLPPC